MSQSHDSSENLNPNPYLKFAIGAVIIGIVGAILSIYSISHHQDVRQFGETDAACNINEVYSCDDIARSEYSEIAGMPLGVFGLGFFIALAVLSLIAFKNEKNRGSSYVAYWIVSILGAVSCLGLAYISFVLIGKGCLICIGVYALNLLNMVWLILLKKQLTLPSMPKPAEIGSGLFSAAIVVAIVLIGYKNFISPAPKSPEVTDIKPEDLATDMNFADKVHDIPVNKSPYAGFGEDYRKGNDDASIVVVEFADFQCPACQSMSFTLNRLSKDFGSDILFVFKNYPLSSVCNPGIPGENHKFACQMAAMARCAGQFGKFWPFHDIAFSQQKDADDEAILDWGRSVGLTDDQMKTCMDSPNKYEKIAADIDLANTVGVDATPTIFINGKKYIGQKDYNTLKAVLAYKVSTNH